MSTTLTETRPTRAKARPETSTFLDILATRHDVVQKSLSRSPWRVIQGVRAGLGEDPLLIPALGGSLPIAEFGDTLGIPCYGIPLANADERNHAPNENMEVDRFLRGISGAAGVLLALGGAL